MFRLHLNDNHYTDVDKYEITKDAVIIFSTPCDNNTSGRILLRRDYVIKIEELPK